MCAEKLSYAGYDQALKLQNDQTQVILGPECGGRVLSYSHQGVEALMLDRSQDGWTWDGVHEPGGIINPTGGRCDIGPEMIVPKRPELWLGKWQGQITGERAARLTSPVAPGPGVRLTRDFELAESGTHLRFTQTQTNVSQGETRWCHWSRTFGQGHGICVVPLTPALSRFPKQYVQYGPGLGINARPDDPAIRVRDGFMEVFDTPISPKLGIDSYAGWFGYLMPNNLLFVKKFMADPTRIYNEVAGLTIALWYREDIVCELEPTGPMEVLQPGESASFTEEWYLVPFAFPADRTALDLGAVAAAAEKVMG